MDELNKSIDSLIEELFAEPVEKASENFEVAPASKTTADAAISSAPKAQNDDSRGAGRPKQISDVPENDEDGKRAGEYDGSISEEDGEQENPEAKKQSRSIDQGSSAGRLGEGPKMKDPRLSKTISDEEYAEFEAFKKAKADEAKKAQEEELKKSEDLKKAEIENLIKSAVISAIKPIKDENEELKKSLQESQTLIKAMAAQPQRSKSITGIEALEKSKPEHAGAQEFSKSEKLDAAERLFKAGKLPMEAVIELENTSTVYNKQWRAEIEKELEKTN